MLLNKLFYTLKPVIPRSTQIFLRRKIVSYRLKRNQNHWPIDETAAARPAGWKGWPGSKKFALVLMHDIDTQLGHDRCLQLMNLEKELGYRSSFYFVPEKYNVSPSVRKSILDSGFEVGVHGLKHDGRLFLTKKIFQKRAERINYYLKDWEVSGFSSPSMLHNLDWMQDLNIKYGTSTFDTDPFEPQPDGVGTIFPFWVLNQAAQKGYMELPYTIPQDFTLFILMRQKDISIWKAKLDWIAENGGMALLNSHPDYMELNGDKLMLDQYPGDYYVEFLKYVKEKYENQYWNVLPSEIADFWLKNFSL